MYNIHNYVRKGPIDPCPSVSVCVCIWCVCVCVSVCPLIKLNQLLYELLSYGNTWSYQTYVLSLDFGWCFIHAIILYIEHRESHYNILIGTKSIACLFLTCIAGDISTVISYFHNQITWNISRKVYAKCMHSHKENTCGVHRWYGSVNVFILIRALVYQYNLVDEHGPTRNKAIKSIQSVDWQGKYAW